MEKEERENLLERVAQASTAPLVLICATPEGRIAEMSLQQCVDTGSRYIHLARNELDNVLADALGG